MENSYQKVWEIFAIVDIYSLVDLIEVFIYKMIENYKRER